MDWSSKRVPLVLVAAVALIGCSVGAFVSVTGGSAEKAPAAVDLGVGDITGLARPGLQAYGNPAERPGILIAWRNTALVEETEVRVRNLGTEAGTGKVWVDLLDAEHTVLHSKPELKEPFVVEVPRGTEGGEQGIIVQVPGSYRMNTLLDNLDRANDPYCIRIRLETLESADGNPIDNVAVKCYNAPARMHPNGVVLHEYTFRNDGDKALQGTIKFERRELPDGWDMEASPKAGTDVTLKPGETVRGSVILRGPDKVDEGDYTVIRPMLVMDNGQVADKSEFFVAADSEAPELTNAFVAPGSEPGNVYLNVTSVDSTSGVAEASGAQVIYSIDADPTHYVRTAAYVDGNFTSPTGFDTNIGPFPDGTEIEFVVAVHDVAGNEARTEPLRITTPVTDQTELDYGR